MDEMKHEDEGLNVESVVQKAVAEYLRTEQAKAEPAYKTELIEERKRREQLEKRVNELVEENKRSRAMAEEADRNAAIRTELQRLGVAKVDLAFKAIRDEVGRGGDGRLVAKSANGEVELREYLQQFVSENPELLPARMAGGSGTPPSKTQQQTSGIELDRIRPGMDPDEHARVREEIARLALQAMKGK